MLAVAHAHRAELDSDVALCRAKHRMEVVHARYLAGQSSYRRLHAARVAFHHACRVRYVAVRRHTRLYQAHVRVRARAFAVAV